MGEHIADGGSGEDFDAALAAAGLLGGEAGDSAMNLGIINPTDPERASQAATRPPSRQERVKEAALLYVQAVIDTGKKGSG